MALIDALVLAAERLHGDDTTVPVLAKGSTITGRVWACVRDDRPVAGPAPPAALFRHSRDRTAGHPQRHLARYRGILQADAHAGFNKLYAPGHKPGPITEAACWAHGRRKLFTLAEVARARLAAEAVRRIGVIFAAERAINGLPAELRLAVRQRQIAPLVAELGTWMWAQRARPSRHAEVGKAMDHMPTALERVEPLPERRSDLPDEQRRRARSAWRGPRPEGLDVRRQRSRRRARRGDAFPDRHRQAEQR